jgi:hypothetical protein
MEGVSDSSVLFLHRPPAPLPKAGDFDPWEGSLDAGHAWKNFGGLSLAQAHQRFLENPLARQEDFMFMGPKAFAYYFPVIDRYLREVLGKEPDDDCSAAILGSATAARLSDTAHPAIQSIAREVAELAAHVIGNLTRYAPDERLQKRILREWRKVEEAAAELPGR